MCLKPVSRDVIDHNNNNNSSSNSNKNNKNNNSDGTLCMAFESDHGSNQMVTRYESGQEDNYDTGIDDSINAKMVVNSRRQYKVLLPTGNPNVTISVRSRGNEDDNDEVRW